MERKRRFQTRQQYAEHKAKETKFEKANKSLNYLIAVVAILIVATLIFIISRDPLPDDEAQKEDQPADVATNEPSQEEGGQAAEDEQTENDDTEENEDASLDEPAQSSTETDDTVSPSTDPSVQEVITNPSWQAYPTAQTGEHVSTYEKGHIDYEEKLKAIFSVLEIEQDNSIVLSVKNNGNTKSSIAVVTSMDKEQKYRVSIEWIDGEGWKPVQVEVLTAID
ncbi:DUF1510 family protein [Solibacillus silvestris]|uniref:YrrS family protein n=1 Tax=Solibacillus silvestris TaxID=76853 RepID=UPI003F7CE216